VESGWGEIPAMGQAKAADIKPLAIGLAIVRIPVKIATHSGVNVATRSSLNVATHSGAMLPPGYRSEATLAVMTYDITNQSVKKNTPEC
jgi:hypothetical protein